MRKQLLDVNFGWEVVGSGSDTRTVQTGNGVAYQEAKDKAIKILRACVDPLESRLAEIATDVDLERYKMPSLKAWMCRGELVVARTKKRAAEMVRTTPPTFNRYYSACDGHWWYEYAQEESLWINQGTWPDTRWERTVTFEEEGVARQLMDTDQEGVKASADL